MMNRTADLANPDMRLFVLTLPSLELTSLHPVLIRMSTDHSPLPHPSPFLYLMYELCHGFHDVKGCYAPHKCVHTMAAASIEDHERIVQRVPF